MADQKLSELTELATTPASDDELYIRDVSEEGAAESKRITVTNLVGAGGAGGGWSAYADYTAGDFLCQFTYPDAGFATASATYVKALELVTQRTGTIRIKFAIKGGDASTTCGGRIYRNGVAVGTEQTITGTTLGIKSEDIAGWSAGDLVQVYIKRTEGAQNAAAQNLQLYTG